MGLIEPLHAFGMDLSDAVLERLPFDVFGDLAMPQCPFEGDELPFLESPGELREIAPGVNAMPFGAGFVLAPVVLPAFQGGHRTTCATLGQTTQQAS